jgi:hypothetical protein
VKCKTFNNAPTILTAKDKTFREATEKKVKYLATTTSQSLASSTSRETTSTSPTTTSTTLDVAM